MSDYAVSRSLTPYEESALLWYMGAPNGLFTEGLNDVAAKAKKVYVTINSLLGIDRAESDRFLEGKKQTPELVTMEGIKKIFELIEIIYKCRDGADIQVPKLVRLARVSEMNEGTEVSSALRSATKLPAKECMALGYGDKNGLAICEYELAPGSVHFDYERLGEKYAKSEEREVLIASGNTLETKFVGYSKEFTGRDGIPAALYTVKVSPCSDYDPDFEQRYQGMVFNESTIALVQEYYKELNEKIGTEFYTPVSPSWYFFWKDVLRRLLINHVHKFY